MLHQINNLTDLINPIVNHLDELDNNREKVIQLTRKLNRESGKGISKLVRGESADESIEACRSLAQQLAQLMKLMAPVIGWNTPAQGIEEYAEFEILYAIVSGSPLPSPNDINVPPWLWLTGLADVVGELRRIILRHLLENRIDVARGFLSTMGQIYDEIAGLEFGKQIAGTLRKKIDTARYLMERTEGDMLMATLGWQISEQNTNSSSDNEHGEDD